VSPPLRPLVRSVERMLAGRTDLLLCISDDELGLAEEAGIRPRRSVVIRNGVDFDGTAAAARQRTLSSDPVAGCVTRLARQKGVDVLLRALASGRWPAELAVEILGDGPQRSELQALASDLGIAQRVRFLGYVEDTRPFLQRWDLFVLPSRYEAGVPLALLESVAANLPVVATAVAGVQQLMSQSSGTVPVDDPEAVAVAVATAVRDWPATVRNALSLRAAASTAYSMTTQLDATEQAYRSLGA
jgi:glycosyltransferase involved in cell wall biosynthesis